MTAKSLASSSPNAPDLAATTDGAAAARELAAAHAAIRAEEAVLVARCRLGDRAALRLVYERYRRRVYSLSLRIAGEQDAEELCQEVFLKAFRSIDKFRGDSQLGTWLYRLAVNASLTHVARGRGRQGKAAPEEALATVSAPVQAQLADGDPKLRGRLEAALAELPPGYRAVLTLHDIEGLQHEEIAEVLGCRVGTSKSQLHKARAKMRELLGPRLGAERGGRDASSQSDAVSPAGPTRAAGGGAGR